MEAFFLPEQRSRIRSIDVSATKQRPTEQPINTDDASTPSTRYWDQPSHLLRNPPPDKVLQLIREQPYRGGFEPAQDFPQPITPRIVYGCVPKDLKGCLSINGPGRIRVGARLLGHWFDGDGYITNISLNGETNEATVFGRYVRTSRYNAQEQHANTNKDNNDVDVNYEVPLAFSGAWTKSGDGKWYENFGKTPENPSNTAVLWLPPSTQSSKPRLFALCEGGHPIELDLNTLEVVREEVQFQSLPSSSKAEKVSSYFSAHYSQDPNDGTIYNHGYVLDPFSPPSINLMKLSPEGHLIHQQMSPMPYNTFVHDGTISQNNIAYFVNPYVVPSGLELLPFIAGQQALGKMMEWKGGHATNQSKEEDSCLKSYLHVHSKDDLALKWKIEMPDPISVYHIVDAFEEEGKTQDELLLKMRVAELYSINPPVDRTRLEKQFTNQYDVPSGTRLQAQLREYIFVLQDDGSGRLLDSSDILSTSSDMSNGFRVGAASCEYPVTNRVGRDIRNRYTWINTLAPGRESPSNWFDAVQKVDMYDASSSSPIVSFGDRVYCSPPLFIPKERLGDSQVNDVLQCDEDDGYIAVMLYKADTHTSDFVILDAKGMNVQCKMELPVHLPYSFHGEWIQIPSVN